MGREREREGYPFDGASSSSCMISSFCDNDQKMKEKKGSRASLSTAIHPNRFQPGSADTHTHTHTHTHSRPHTHTHTLRLTVPIRSLNPGRSLWTLSPSPSSLVGQKKHVEKKSRPSEENTNRGVFDVDRRPGSRSGFCNPKALCFMAESKAASVFFSFSHGRTADWDIGAGPSLIGPFSACLPPPLPPLRPPVYTSRWFPLLLLLLPQYRRLATWTREHSVNRYIGSYMGGGGGEN